MRAGLILLILPALVYANGFPHFAISREQLLALLTSPDPQQRLSAATSLGIRREVAAVGALLEVVERPDELKAVKVEALEALGMLRDTGVMPRLLDHLSREPAPRVRGQIVVRDHGPNIAKLSFGATAVWAHSDPRHGRGCAD
jgi:HEAT repeats